GFKLIIVGGVLAVEGVAAVVQNDLGDGLLASEIGKLFKIILNIFSGADQGIERGGSVGGDFAWRGLSKARRAQDTHDTDADDGERGHQRHGPGTFPREVDHPAHLRSAPPNRYPKVKLVCW